MTSDTSNLILEQLRLVRAEIADTKTSLKSEIAELRDSVDSMDTQLHGLTYIVTTAVGSLVMEMKGIKNRVEALEEA